MFKPAFRDPSKKTDIVN